MLKQLAVMFCYVSKLACEVSVLCRELFVCKDSRDDVQEVVEFGYHSYTERCLGSRLFPWP